MSDLPSTDRFLRACRREPVDRTPVWFMRQAGRYLPEYRELRGDRDILEHVPDPDLVAEITLQPLRRMAVDAAILFSDIMVPLAGRGRRPSGSSPASDLWSTSPSVRSPTSSGSARSSPKPTCRTCWRRSGCCARSSTVPLIGFAGAPFTLASYLVEGGPSRNARADEGADARRARRVGRA